jgi:hypothetical protein
MSYIEVDQSGKIEDLRQDTIIAYSNDHSMSIRLPKRIKREIFLQYRPKVKQIVQKIFSICLYHLLEERMEKQESIIICAEYTGWEAFIKREICLMLAGRQFDDRIIKFGIIGKRSPAHRVALLTNRKEMNPSRDIHIEEITRYLK